MSGNPPTGRGRARSKPKPDGASDQQGRPGPAQGPPQGRGGQAPAWGPRGGGRASGGPPQQGQWGPPPAGGGPPSGPPAAAAAAPPAQGAWGARAQQQAHQVRAPAPQQAPAFQSGRATVRTGGGDGPGASRTVEGTVSGAGGEGDVHSGRGGIRGRRAIQEPIIVTRPKDYNKKGSFGQVIKLRTNYFRLIEKPDWTLYQYRVDFAPDPESTFAKKRIFRTVTKDLIPAKMFDGTMLFTCQRLDPNPMQLFGDNDGTTVTVNIRLVGDVSGGDYQYIQFFNIVLRSCMERLKLQMVGRNYFDAIAKVSIAEYKLELWPGYITSIRQHEREVLLCCEVTHKVMRMETVWHMLQEFITQARAGYEAAFNAAVIGMTVLTDYNNRTYRIDDVDWKETVADSFEMADKSRKSYIDYYREKWHINIRNKKQPMLVSRAKARDIRAGMSEVTKLVPELCRPTGLTDAQKNNFHLMKAVGAHTRVGPGIRQNKLVEFARRMVGAPEVMAQLNSWDLRLSQQLVEVAGRILPKETIIQGPNGTNKFVPAMHADWTRDIQRRPFLVYGQLEKWVVIYPKEKSSATNSFCQLIQKAATNVNWRIPNPIPFDIQNDRNSTYLEALEQVMEKHKPNIIMCVVPNNKIERYSAIKKKCTVDHAMPTQVILQKNLESKGAMSIATKVMIQINCKLGGAPWAVEIPLTGLMVVGFDVSHDTTNKSQSYGAMVASLDRHCTRYFADVVQHSHGNEMSDHLPVMVSKALRQYMEVNQGALPKNIIIYRDGVGEGQVNQVIEHEWSMLYKRLKEGIYKTAELKIAFCIVSKRINTRFFANDQNPIPGTVVDDVVTLPERVDFFIVSQCVREGTVSPTSYNVIKNQLGLDPDKFQRLTYKFCHTYYNCSNTVGVPAPCQYAHKLAGLVGGALHRSPNAALQNTLYYL